MQFLPKVAQKNYFNNKKNTDIKFTLVELRLLELELKPIIVNLLSPGYLINFQAHHVISRPGEQWRFSRKHL